MARYNRIYQRLAERAVAQGVVDFETLVKMAAEMGMSSASLEEELLHDLETDGPIFGKFIRSLTGASASATVAASRQGETMAIIEVGHPEIMRELGVDTLEDVVEDADPEEMGAIEDYSADRIALTWVATLENTCHKCLPLHGKTLLKEEWEASGFDPSTIHEGWISTCKCELVPAESRDKKRYIDPLIRTKIKSETGLKGSKKTARSVLQVDVDKANQAMANAMDTLEGRRTLRLLGQMKTKIKS